MNKIFAFSGAHCVGKTTLMANLVKELNITCIDSMSSNINKYNNVFSKDAIQLEILRREYDFLLNKRHSAADLIKDRCILDIMMYTQFSQQSNEVSEEIAIIVENAFKTLINYYNIIFIIPIKPNLNYNFEREKFSYAFDNRSQINEMFLQFYNQYKNTYKNLHLLEADTFIGMKEEALTIINTLSNTI